MSRHAYLIMAHNHFEQLRALLRCLDDGRNVIYLHLDAKLGTVDVGQFKNQLKHAELCVLRLNVSFACWKHLYLAIMIIII